VPAPPPWLVQTPYFTALTQPYFTALTQPYFTTRVGRVRADASGWDGEAATTGARGFFR